MIATTIIQNFFVIRILPSALRTNFLFQPATLADFQFQTRVIRVWGYKAQAKKHYFMPFRLGFKPNQNTF
jgi:hypothetical protein